MKAEIIAVGSELLTPDRLDTNSLFLTAELNKLGIEVTRKCVVGDKREDVREAFAHGLSRSDVTISTGGLGPTEDDLTREVVADLLGRKLESNIEVLRGIEQRFEKIGRKMVQINARQAMSSGRRDRSGEYRAGPRPDCGWNRSGRIVILSPGPPTGEMQTMFARQ